MLNLFPSILFAFLILQMVKARTPLTFLRQTVLRILVLAREIRHTYLLEGNRYI